MKYTLQNLLADFDDEFLFKSSVAGDPFMEYVNQPNIIQDTKPFKQFLTDKITKLVTEAVGIIDELPDREMSSQVKDTREWMNFGRNQLRQQILSVISQK